MASSWWVQPAPHACSSTGRVCGLTSRYVRNRSGTRLVGAGAPWGVVLSAPPLKNALVQGHVPPDVSGIATTCDPLITDSETGGSETTTFKYARGGKIDIRRLRESAGKLQENWCQNCSHFAVGDLNFHFILQHLCMFQPEVAIIHQKFSEKHASL